MGCAAGVGQEEDERIRAQGSPVSRSQSGRAFIVRLATVVGHAGKKILEIIWNNHSHLGGLEKGLDVNTL